jgi:hypothetical protein
MKRLKLWSLILGLAVGNLMGCSRASTKSPDASDGTRAGREFAEGRQEVGPGTTDGKPSACVKWDKSSRRLSKPPRKAAKDTAVPERVLDREKNLQAQNENQPH